MRLFKFAIILFFSLLLLAVLATGSLAVFSLQDFPLVSKSKNLTAHEITRVKSFINANNPSHFRKGQKKTTIITEQDINLLANYALNKLNGRARTKVKVFNASAHLTGTIKLPGNPLGEYLNVSTIISQQENSIIVKSMEIGDVTVPGFISDLLLSITHQKLQKQFPEYRIAINSLTDFRLRKKQASISYVWQPEIMSQLKNRVATLIPKKLRQRIFIYTQKLQKTSPTIQQKRPSLSALLKPMFNFAIKRSKNNNPVEENRALFIVLGAYMMDKNIPQLLGNKSIGKLKRKTFYLLKRDDLSQHLLVSAAITALSDPDLAQSIGLEKEVKDSDGGSGFSFSDLAADRAGVALANSAFRSRRQAHLIQQRLANVNNESDYMPDVNNLPSGLKNIDFKMIYTDTNSAAYKNIIQVIDKRIAACNIYR